MISRLRGILVEKKTPFILLDVNGVGYELQASLNTISKLPALDEQVALLTHMIVREDAHLLYGFYTENERSLFREIIKVSGVGPKLALAILSGMDVVNFVSCIEQRNIELLVKLPGVGKKTAERLLVEMQNKLTSKINSNQTFSEVLFTTTTTNSINVTSDNEAITALMALGYKINEATKAVSRVLDQKKDQDSETLIKLALQSLAK